MSDDAASSTKWRTFGTVAILLALVVGLLFFYFTGLILESIALIVMLIGVYEIIASFEKSKKVDQFGTSESYAAMLWGFVFISVGGAIFIFAFTGNIIFAVVFILLVMAAYLLVKRTAGNGN